MLISSFQKRVSRWMGECFSKSLVTCRKERAQRFIEEALELAQAEGLTRGDCDLMVDYVFDRPVGRPEQEVGGVMLTLAALCASRRYNMEACAANELNRVRKPEVTEKIRAKQASKSAILGITSGA